jgi:hypothetical protein
MLMVALPSLRVLCSDGCAPVSDHVVTPAEEPACHDGRGDSTAPAPVDPAEGCAHGGASSSPVVRPVGNGAPDQVETLVVSRTPHPWPEAAPLPASPVRPQAPVFLPSGFPPPLRC